ncbi:wlm domain-containing protein [Rutstroemia sp. NJR-2017a WRK4]|nr:wlm domain-containing protein [Rutstroemia sp. NJR-2017a WRK4]
MAADTENIDMTTDNQDLVSLTIAHHGKPHTFSLPSTATISDLSESISATLSIPPSNQKLMISKLGLLKPPFKDPSLPITSLLDKKITLMGSTASEASSVAEGALAASRRVNATPPKQKVSAYKTHDWKKEQEEATYTFHTLRPLPYLPNPSRSLQFLQRLKDDAGIKAAMRKHKFSVPLLTEMNPVEHTTSTHEGTSRTLGLNRNQGEVIELRLRTDAYDGYRDYKTIRKTLCHELAHCVWGPHDRNFWNLCKEIEKEVEGADWRSGGRAVGDQEEYYGGEVDDHGGWTGGEFVLGVGGAGGAESTGGGVANAGQGMSRREILAKAAEERMRKVREEHNAREGEGA